MIGPFFVYPVRVSPLGSGTQWLPEKISCLCSQHVACSKRVNTTRAKKATAPAVAKLLKSVEEPIGIRLAHLCCHPTALSIIPIAFLDEPHLKYTSQRCSPLSAKPVIAPKAVSTATTRSAMSLQTCPDKLAKILTWSPDTTTHVPQLHCINTACFT